MQSTYFKNFLSLASQEKPLEMRCTSEVSSHDFLGLKSESSRVTTIRKFINAEDVTSGCEKLYKKGSM